MTGHSDNSNSRRGFLIGTGSFAVATFLLSARGRAQGETRTRIILLGTKGGPTLGTIGLSTKFLPAVALLAVGLNSYKDTNLFLVMVLNKDGKISSVNFAA